MASRTQLRLAQLTGSLDDTKAAAASISEASIQGVLDHLAASIKRIHGGSVFQNQTAGAFSQTIDVTGAVTASAGVNVGGDLNVTTTAQVGTDLTVGNDLTLATDAGIIKFGDDEATTLTHSNGNGLLLGGAEAKLAFGQSDFAEAIYSSTDGQVDIVAGTEVQIVAPTIDIDASSEVNISNDLVVGGNLTVNGSQTVLDTTSLVIEDSVIALSSGSAANADVNSAMVFQRATANLGGGTDMQNGALMFLQGTGFKLGYTNDNAETAQGSLAIADDDLGDVYVGKLLIDGSTNTLDVTSNDLTAVAAANFKVDAAADIVLDADSGTINIEDGGTRTGLLKYISAQNIFALSSSVGNDLGLDANTGNILFAKEGGGGSSPATAAVNVATANEIKFGHYDAPNSAYNVGFLTLKDNAVSVLSASSGLQIDAGANPAQLQLVDATTNVLTIDVPTAVTTYTLTLPGAVGSSSQVLRLADGSGNLEFADVSAAGNTKKAVRVISSAILPEANVDMDTNEADHSDFAAGALAGLVGSPNVVDVFVNGQLMTTGSAAQITAAERDYRITTGNILVFSFGLEADDVVQVITRG